MNDMSNYVNPRNGQYAPLLEEVRLWITRIFWFHIIYNRDFNYDYFGFKLKDLYLLKINGKIVERPQHMLMRVSLEFT
jgi:ribonucleoside-diphosphate reductase alpha chain